MVYSHEQLKTFLPHRHPLLLVDAITHLEPWDRIVGVKAVTGTEGCYGLVPDGAPRSAYAYPCSLMVESFGQTGGVLINSWRKHDNLPADVIMLAAGITGMRFLEPVFPGDLMEHRVLIEKNMADFAILSGEVRVRDRTVAVVEGMIVAYRHESLIFNEKR